MTSDMIGELLLSSTSSHTGTRCVCTLADNFMHGVQDEATGSQISLVHKV